MKIQYQEHDVESVMSYFAAGFEMKEGQKLFNHEWFYDSKKGKVVFRLTIQEKQDSRESMLGE